MYTFDNLPNLPCSFCPEMCWVVGLFPLWNHSLLLEPQSHGSVKLEEVLSKCIYKQTKKRFIIGSTKIKPFTDKLKNIKQQVSIANRLIYK